MVLVAAVALLFLSGGIAQRRQKRVRLTAENARRFAGSKNAALSALANRATELAERSLEGERGGRINRLLEQAGIAMRPAEFVVLTGVGVVVGLTVGYIIFGVLGALVGASLVLVVARFYLSRKAEKRTEAFGEQLSDTLYIMAGSLRAGFGLLQAIDVVAAEAPSPTAEEFQRVKVEIQLGRDTDEALAAMAERVRSEDFRWVTEAIEIHREVGGDIAEILDSVNATIRDRNQIRRRIRALSAEGRISALVLILLPLALVLLIWFINPSYLAELTDTNVGRLLIAVGLVAMVIGVVWIRRVIRLQF